MPGLPCRWPAPRLPDHHAPGRPQLHTHRSRRPVPPAPDDHARIASVAFGIALRRLRARIGVSQEELGERSDEHRNYVGHVERGEGNPTLASVAKLLHGLALPTEDVVAEIIRCLTEVQTAAAAHAETKAVRA
jgi:ribosome-binding protein aMBF1 (putative translation factor)